MQFSRSNQHTIGELLRANEVKLARERLPWLNTVIFSMYLLKPTLYAYVRVHTYSSAERRSWQPAKSAPTEYMPLTWRIYFLTLSPRDVFPHACVFLSSSFSSFFLFAYTRATVTSLPQRHTLLEASERETMFSSLRSCTFALAYLWTFHRVYHG